MKKMEISESTNKAPEDNREHLNVIFIGHVGK